LLEILSCPVLSTAPDVDACTDDNFPLETTYSVQKVGMHSEILEDILLPLNFLKYIFLSVNAVSNII